MDKNETDNRTFPMDFTNIGQELQNQTYLDEQYLRNQQYNSPGIFNSVQRNGRYDKTNNLPQTDPRTVYGSVPGTDFSSAPATDKSFGADGSSGPTFTSTPREANRETVNTRSDIVRDNRWKQFLLAWTWFIITSILVIVWFAYMFPFHDIVCWLQQNSLIIALTIVVTFLVSVIVKFMLNETSTIFKSTDISNNCEQEKENGIRRRLNFDLNTTPQSDSSNYMSRNTSVNQSNFKPATSRSEIQVKRTFSGTAKEVWADYLRYFQNISKLNEWNEERKLLVFMTTLRGQAETFVHGLSPDIRMQWDRLINSMELRFGHSNMKESYLAEAKLRKRMPGESFRDLGQAIEDLYRRAYPVSPEVVQENSIRTFLDACGESEEFRVAIRRTKPKTLQEAVTSAMQEECIRINERNMNRPIRRNIYAVDKMENNERTNVTPHRNSPTNGQFVKRNPRQFIICRNCGKRNHNTENCWSKLKSVQNVSKIQTVPIDTARRGKGTAQRLNEHRSEQ